MTDELHSGLETLFLEARSAAGIQAFEPAEVPATYLVQRRVDETIETIDLEKFLPAPRRPKGTVKVRTAQNFIDYVNAYKHPGKLLMVADKDGVTAVLNHHEKTPATDREAQPGWGDWRCYLDFEVTPSWSGWSGFAGSWQTQESLANWLEENALDIVEPDAGHLLDVVSNLRLASESKVARRINLQNGAVRFVFEENFIPQGGGEGDEGVLEVPPRFTIRTQVYVDGPVFEIPVILRYQVKNGQVLWLFKFTAEKDRILRDALDNVTAVIHESVGQPVFRGSV